MTTFFSSKRGSSGNSDSYSYQNADHSHVNSSTDAGADHLIDDDQFNLNTHPTLSELNDYIDTLNADELIDAIRARFVIAERCLDIAKKIIQNEDDMLESKTSASPAQQQRRQSIDLDDDNKQRDALQHNLSDTIHNAREAAGEIKFMVNKLGELLYSSGDATAKQRQERQVYRNKLNELDKEILSTLQRSKELKEKSARNQNSVRIDIDKQRYATISRRDKDKVSRANQQQQRQQQQYDAYKHADADHQPSPQQFQVLSEWTADEQREFEEEMRLRRQFIYEIERDVLQVHEMFRDLNAMVHLQQYAVDSIEQAIMETSEKTKGGMKELYIAEQYQRKKRAKMCCLVLAMALIILIVILAVSIVLS